MAISTILVFLTMMVHYEMLRVTWSMLPRMTMAPRARIIILLTVVFLAHTIEVWLYAIGFFLITDHLGLGSFRGETTGAFFDYLYFSTVSYTSLGLGDVYPTRHLRLITGVEALNGLVLIGWSASFTYLAMEKFWPLHERRQRRKSVVLNSGPVSDKTIGKSER